jgi:putative addiction module component (TIGR02574 family)
MGHPEIEISRLSVAERLELAELLWTSIARTPEEVPITAAQRAELDRRLDDAERDGSGGIAWEEVVARLRERAS